MTRIVTTALLLAISTGCIIVDRRPDPTPVVPVVNSAPYVFDAVGACYYDAYNRDDIVYFDVTVDDPDGIYDVVSVYVDVVDELRGEIVQTFELYPTDDPYRWFSDWLVSTTWVDCFDPYLSVDVYVYDQFDAYGVSTIPLGSY